MKKKKSLSKQLYKKYEYEQAKSTVKEKSHLMTKIAKNPLISKILCYSQVRVHFKKNIQIESPLKNKKNNSKEFFN